MPKDELFFNALIQLSLHQSNVSKKQEQYHQSQLSQTRLGNALFHDNLHTQKLQGELRAASFDLMLHTSCRKFDKLMPLIEVDCGG